MAFGMSTEFNRIFYASTYIHFAGEDIVAVHMLYSSKTAKILSIVICGAYSLEAVLFAPFAAVSTIGMVFGIQFVFSDVLSALSAFCLMMNNRTSLQMRNCAFAILLHFIGVSFALALEVMIYFHFENLLQRGEGWMLLLAAALFQLYFLRDALASKYNHGQSHSISFPLWIKIAVPLAAVLIPVGFGLMNLFRTTESSGSLKVASSIWDELIAWFAWPLGVVLILVAIKIQNEGRNKVNKKL